MTQAKPWNLELVTRRTAGDAGRHYTCNRILGDAMDILRDFEPDDINWVFLSTSGVHGSYISLDDIEQRISGEATSEDMQDGEEVTVLIVLPRMVVTCYGNAIIRTREDIALLRRLVEKTFIGIAELQKGNRAKEDI